MRRADCKCTRSKKRSGEADYGKRNGWIVCLKLRSCIERRLIKGSITVFLSLMLVVMLTVIQISFFCVKTAAGRAQLANASDQAMVSLFAQYDRDVFEKYDLFVINAGYDSGSLQMGKLLDRFEDAADYILNPNKDLLICNGRNLINVSLESTAVTGYTLASEQNGYVLADQAIQYMKKTSALQGLSLVSEHLQETCEETREAEEYGKEAESTCPAGSYDDVLNENIEKSGSGDDNNQGISKESAESVFRNAGILKLQMKAAGEDGGSDLYSEGFSNNQFTQKDTKESLVQKGTDVTALLETSSEENAGNSDDTGALTSLRNVVEMESLRQTSILNLVCENPSSVSGRTISKDSLLSEYGTESSLGSVEISEDVDSVSSALWLNEYLVTHFGNYVSPENGNGLKYPLEQILQGKNSDSKNLEAVVKKLLFIREGVNFLYIKQDTALKAQADTAATAISAFILQPELLEPLSELIQVGWAYCESLLDVRSLLAGDQIPLTKSAETWQMKSLSDIAGFKSRMDSLRNKNGSGLSYKDYLRILLTMMDTDKKCQGMMNMMDHEIRMSGRDNFRFDQCITSLSLEIKAISEGRTELKAEKSLSYGGLTKDDSG